MCFGVVEQPGSVKMFRVPSAIRFQNLTETIFSALAYPPTERDVWLVSLETREVACNQLSGGEGQSDKQSLVRPPANSITCHWGRYRSFSFLQATPLLSVWDPWRRLLKLTNQPFKRTRPSSDKFRPAVSGTTVLERHHRLCRTRSRGPNSTSGTSDANNDYVF